MIEALKSMYMNTQGKPVKLDFEVNGRPQSIILEKDAIFDASFYKATNVKVDGKPLFDSTLKYLGDIVKQAVILDIETTGKVGGSVITEAALFNAEENLVDIFYLKPYHMVNMGADDMEAAGMSSKVDRSVLNIKSAVRPKSHASSFFAKHLSEILRENDPTDFLLHSGALFSETYNKADNSFIDFVTKSKNVNKLELENAILKLDKQKGLFSNPAVRDYMLKYVAEKDPFQARYYVEDLEEAERVGIRRHLFGSSDDQEIHKMLSYLRDPSEMGSPAEMIKRSEETKAMFQRRYGASADLEVRSHYVDTDELIEGLTKRMQGKSVHAAYALFESKQFGALIRGRILEDLIAKDDSILKMEPKKVNKIVEQELITRAEAGNPFLKVIQGVSYTGDPFYTTGQEYNLEKALAQKNNNFAGLLNSYLKTTGPKEVRDIQDVQKMVQGTIHELGLQDIPKPQGMSVEVQARLFGAAQQISEGVDTDSVLKSLLEKEAHLAGGDAAISSPKLISSGLEFAVAGQEFQKKTPLGMHFYGEALEGRGPLMGLFAYGKLSKFFSQTFGPDDLGLMDILYEQRIARNMQKVVDTTGHQTFKNVEGTTFMEVPSYAIDDSGKRVQIDRTTPYARTKNYMGMEGVYSSSRVFARDYANVEAETTINRLASKINKDDLLLDFDQQQQRYILPQISNNATPTEQKDYSMRIGKIRSRLDSLVESNSDQVDLFARRVLGETGVSVRPVIESVKDELKKSKALEEFELTSNLVSSKNNAERAFGNHSALKMAKGVLAPVMGFGLAMSGLSTLEAFQQPEKSSYLIPSYKDWFSAQAQMFGSSEAFTRAMQEKTGYIEGMGETGLAARLRKFSSDFGSPYTGPSYSNETLQYNELLRARQRKLRHVYQARHLEFNGDIRGLIGRFISKSFAPPELQNRSLGFRTMLSESSVGASAYTSLKGKNLTKISVSDNYHMNMEDADTISLKRNFGGGGFKDFFSGRKSTQSMSVRLAGIDSPEVAHGNRGAQPYAEAAKRIAQDMVSKAKNVEVVFDKSDSTYGRRVGVLYADGVNVNLELIKRGAAAYLPYRSKKGRPIYDTQEFAAAQENAYKSKRGMWRTDFFNSYKQIAEASGQTVTFNTLASPDKVARSSSLMTMYSAMKTAENFGMQSTEAQMALADSGISLKNKASSSKHNIFKPDFNQNEWTDPSLAVMQQTNSILNGMHELKTDLSSMIKTRGSEGGAKYSTLNVKHLDANLAKELSSPVYNSFNKDYKFNYQNKQRKLGRLKAMEALQQKQNHRMFSYSSGHHRM